NPAGWAPFSVLTTGDASLLILPGPPKEMEAVFSMYAEDLIASQTAMKSAALRVVVEMFESEVSPLLSEVMNRVPNTYLKAYGADRGTEWGRTGSGYWRLLAPRNAQMNMLGRLSQPERTRCLVRIRARR